MSSKNRLPRLALVAAFSLTLLGLGACMMESPSAPPNLVAARAAAAQYNVQIVRDDFGVPHIYGPRNADTAFGLAYAASEDDFATILETAVTMRGTLASYKGPDAAVTDYLVRLLKVWEVVEAKWQSEPSPQAQAIAQAYADGLNLYAAEHPDELWADIYPFTPQDIFVGILFKQPLFFGVERELRKVLEGRTETAQQVATSEPFFQTMGSNTMAVSPKRSADNVTRLFANSHQPFTGPVAWYEAHLKSDEGLDIIGGTFPGFPLIGHGVRPELGWAFTVNLPDMTDVYRLTLNPDNENEYLLDGEYIPFDRSEAKIKVKLLGFLPWTVTREVIWSKHGPAMRTDKGVFALRFPGMDDLRSLDQYLGLNTATNFNEWRDAMRINAIPSFNAVYADKSGTIAHFHNSRFPKRKADAGIDWRGVVPGDRSDLIWTEEYGFDKVPAVIRPKSGFVFSANSTPFDVTDGPDNADRSTWPEELWVEERYTNRAHRIKETYGADKSITRDEFIAYKYDLAYSEKSQIAEGIREILAADFSDDPTLQAAQKHLSQWDYQTNMENRHAALAIYSFFPSIAAEVKGEEWPSPIAGFKQAAQTLTDKFGTYDLEWGKVNRVRRGDVNVPVNGGPDIVRAIYDVDGPEADGGLMATVGDCYIALAEWAPDGTQTLATVHQFGSAASRPNSPHYADQVPLFAGQTLKPMTFDWDAITANAQATYRPGE